MKTYVVKRGDSLSKIAQSHKLRSWQEIYNHPKNAAFRAKRPNPNVIQPGDSFFIPGTMIKNQQKGKCYAINLDHHRRTINKYALANGLKQAVSIETESWDKDLFIRVLSLGTLKRLQSYEIDQNLLTQKREKITQECKAKYTQILKGNRKQIPSLLQKWMQSMATETKKAFQDLEKVRSQVAKHNDSQAGRAQFWGRLYSVVKAGTDVGLAFGGGAGLVGTVVVEGVGLIDNPPADGDVIGFFDQTKGSSVGTFMKLNEEVWRAGTPPGLPAVAAKRIANASSVIGVVFAGVDLKKNWDSFN